MDKVIDKTSKKDNKYKYLNVEFDKISRKTTAKIKGSTVVAFVFLAVFFAGCIGVMLWALLGQWKEKNIRIGVLCLSIFVALGCLAWVINILRRLFYEKRMVKEKQKTENNLA